MGRMGTKVEVDQEAWLNSMRKKLKSLDDKGQNPELPLIFRVSPEIRKTDKAAYEPRVLSIGPYHRGKKRLKPMEKHKWKYLKAFLSRIKDQKLEAFVKALQEVEERSRRCYSETIALGSNEFTEMMLLDGCFIVELFLRFYEEPNITDPIHGPEWVFQCVANDLLLAENQIPFLVVHQVFGLCSISGPSCSLEELAINFFKISDNIIRTNGEIPQVPSAHHLLHLVHSSLLPPIPPPSSQSKNTHLLTSVLSKVDCITLKNRFSSCPLLPISKKHKSPDMDRRPITMIPCAAKLQDAGVRFRRRKGLNLLDIKFNNGVLEIPHIFIEDTTNVLLRNLIAFEQCCPYNGNGRQFTMYAAFMDYIVNSAADVEILHQNGILEHGLGSNDGVADLFNGLCKGVIIGFDECFFSRLMKEVREYSGTGWHEWRAKLMQEYFNSPWTIMSVGAAIVLLSLTFLQTFFSMYAYFRPPS